MLDTIFIAILLCSAIYDYRTHIVKDRYWLTIGVLAVLKSTDYSELLSNAVLIIPVIIALGFMKCGGGDLKFIFALSLYLGVEICVICIGLAMLLVLGFYRLLLPMKGKIVESDFNYPLLPFLNSSIVFVYTIYLI